MEKFPFTPDGVAALNSQLYQLPDTELALEASAIEMDLIAWASSHFILSAEQLTYLNAINAQVIHFMSFQISYAVGNRLPVNLVKDQAKSSRSEGTKLIETKGKLSATNLPDDTAVADGEVNIIVTYQ